MTMNYRLLFLLAALPAFAQDKDKDFTALVERVQKNPAAVAADDVSRMYDLGKQLGRPFAASVAGKAWLTQNLNAPAPLLRQAAENAELAGDLRAAASRYKQYLRSAPANAEASAAAARLYQIQVDYLAATDDAFRTMDELGDTLRQSVAARKYDQWFLETARSRRAAGSVARRLAGMLADQGPLELERLTCWDSLEWLLDELALAKPEHAELLPACRRIVPLIRNSPRLSGRAAFLTAHLTFKTGGSEFEPVAAAARAYLDAAPTFDTLREILCVLAGGPGQFNDAVWSRLPAARRELFVAGFTKLPDSERAAFLNWPGLPVTVATPAQWTELAGKSPAIFRAAAGTANLPFLGATNDVALLKLQAEFLRGVPSMTAAIVNSLAASTDANAQLQALVQNEAWHLPPAQLNLAVDAITRDAKVLARFGSESVSQTPLALFAVDLARNCVTAAWRTGDRAQLHAYDWVPWTDDQRRYVFGIAFNEFKGAPRSKETAADFAAAQELFTQVMAPTVVDVTKAPNPLCRELAKAVVAARAKNRDEYQIGRAHV